MSDITTELRSLARWLRQLSANEPEPECKASHTDCANDCEEAADEIDRLREANRYLVGISNEAMEDARKYADAQKEIARLREALTHIAEYWNRSENDTAMNDALFHMIETAEGALAQVAEVGK